MLDPFRLSAHRLRNGVQSLLLIGGMAWILATSARLILGLDPFWTALMLIALLLLAPRISPTLILRLYRARLITPEAAPELHALVAALARRAELPHAPRLFLIPSSMPNAMALGAPDQSAIAVTDALLRLMNREELAGVLAHEISHIRHRDTWIMGLADMIARLTWSLSWAGQMLLFLNLPLILMGLPVISWAGLLMLIFAPHASALLQLAMSRTREYDADLGAAWLTGHPEWLISALGKLERANRGWERWFRPDAGGLDASLLRTHPPTTERIRRLQELQIRPPAGDLPLGGAIFPELPHTMHPPRRRMGGLWY
ncbi:MAG: zinc metalloprotease HtpX [Mariprofundaceae bacterium]